MRSDKLTNEQESHYGAYEWIDHDKIQTRGNGPGRINKSNTSWPRWVIPVAMIALWSVLSLCGGFIGL